MTECGRKTKLAYISQRKRARERKEAHTYIVKESGRVILNYD